MGNDNDLKDVLSAINKTIKGRNPIIMASSLEKKERLSTGVPEIDKLIGGGWVCGNFSECFGLEASGKSTLMLHTIKSAQEKGHNVLVIDLEHKFDVERADSLGVKRDSSFVYMGDDIKYAEEVMNIIKAVVETGKIKLIVIDSVTAMTPQLENETKKGKEIGMEDDQMALIARLLSKFFRKDCTSIAKNKVCVLLVCQGRTAGIGGFATYVDTTGGNAKKHYGVVRLEMRQGKGANAPVVKHKVEIEEMDPDTEEMVIKKKTVEEKIGFESVITVEKDHAFGCAHIGTQLRLPFYFDTGFLKPEEKPIEPTVVTPEEPKVEEKKKRKTKKCE